jgi:hypothetical protein
MERERENARPDEFVIPKDLPEVEGKKDAARPLVSGGLRCPFCHSDVRAEASDWCACKSCLARHHEACWKESKVCAACGSSEMLVASTQHSDRTPPGMKRAMKRAVVGLGVTLWFVFGLAGFFRVTSSESPTAETVTERPTDKPRTHTRAFFTKTEPHKLEWVDSTTGGHIIRTTDAVTVDGFAEILRQKIQDGGKLVNPAPEEAARILRKVVEFYKQDQLDEDVYLMEEAIRRLGVAPVSAAAEAGALDRLRGISDANRKSRSLDDLFGSAMGVNELAALKKRAESEPSSVLFLNGLQRLTNEDALALAGSQARVLVLNDLQDLDPTAAEGLARWPGDTLLLEGLRSTDAIRVARLRWWKGQRLFLDGLTDVNSPTAAELRAFEGSYLSLRGVRTMDPGAKPLLLGFKGTIVIAFPPAK